jgi:formylglycine-generating enzyme required for sulfatase activity
MANTQLLAISATESIPMIDIPAGEFLMGSDESDPYANSDEMPQHLVHLQEFSISQAPITQDQWRAVARLPKVDRRLDPNPSYFKGYNRPGSMPRHQPLRSVLSPALRWHWSL